MPGDIQRTAHLEEPTLVIQHMHLRFVEIPAGRLVEHESAVVPAVPQSLDDLDELRGSGVARFVVEGRLQPEVLGFQLRPGRHHVPTGAALADQVQGGELAREIVRLVVGGGRRRHQADMPGDHGQGRQQGHRFQLDHVAAGPGERATRRVALANAGAVGKEDHVEPAALGDLGALHIMLDVQRAIGRHVGMAPGGRVITMAAYRQTESHLACRHYSPTFSVIPSGAARRAAQSRDLFLPTRQQNRSLHYASLRSAPVGMTDV
jgi:hypothetical protein